MKKRNSSFKNKIIKFIAMTLLVQFMILIGTDIVSQNLYNKIVMHYSQITTINPQTIKNTVSTLSDPIKSAIQEVKNQIKK